MENGRNNSLDLNNLPEEYGREGKQVFLDGSAIFTEALSDTSRCRKKKSGGKDDCGKVYECRFCSLKFCKSQALGGHMNRHRQERETETLNRARQLVFGNDNLASQAPPHLGLRDISLGGAQSIPYNQSGSNISGDPSSLTFRSSAYPSRFFSGSSSTVAVAPPPPPPPYPYTSQSRLVPYPTQYGHHHHQVNNEYYVGHILNTGSSNRHQPNPSYSSAGTTESSYTCIGAPLGRDFHGDDDQDGCIRGMDLSTSTGLIREGVNWDRSYGGSSTQCFDPPLINRFQDRF